MKSHQGESIMNVSQFVEQLILSRQINQRQYSQLSAAILADGKVDEEERRQINRLFDAIQAGQVRIVS